MKDFSIADGFSEKIYSLNVGIEKHVAYRPRPSVPQARVGDVPYALIIVLYASMILVGGMGNLLVILVVVRNAAMRTARNVFIVNLAVSDLMLCLITMPLTLVEILYQTWQVRTDSQPW